MGWRLQEEDNINSEKLDQIIDMVGLLLDESREKPVERLLTKKEAQELLSCSERTINYHLFEKNLTRADPSDKTQPCASQLSVDACTDRLLDRLESMGLLPSTSA